MEEEIKVCVFCQAPLDEYGACPNSPMTDSELELAQLMAGEVIWTNQEDQPV